ncbi:MAG TPA: putative hydro-lyase [Ramlibacter sp.]|nr:putative hydro-lyase [Ramlibacter sp.]
MNLDTSLIRTGRDARMAIRGGHLRGDTSSMAPGYVQANLAIIPKAWAYDFLKFCQRNPKPCPLLGVSEAGEVGMPRLASELDIRTDVAGYRVWREGRFTEDVDSLRELWRDDFVTFAIGCSFSFEQALLAHGVSVRNVEQDVNVSMFITNIPTETSGPFGGPLVVTMRPMRAEEAIRAVQITARYPRVHGAPIHFGEPAQIGIGDLANPDFGEPVEVRDGEVPVFWACGVTPQMAIQQAKLPICITHIPGHMLVTDLLNSELEFQ